MNPKNVTHNELKALFHSNNTLHPVHIKLDGVQEPARRERKGLTFTIHIEDYENKVIPRPAVISSIDTIALNTCGNFMGDIKTVCISDSMVYVLTEPMPYGGFQIPSGDFVKRIRNVGHGNGEYVSAWAMTLGDSLLFLMDFDTKSILAYDAVLNYKSSFRYGFPAMDFIKVKDGFLFLNLLATEVTSHCAYQQSGEVQQSYLPSKMSLDMIYNETSFVRDKTGKFIFPPFSNEIYRWTSEDQNRHSEQISVEIPPKTM